MPAWNDYKTEAKQRGSLAFELYVVESTPITPPEEVKQRTSRPPGVSNHHDRLVVGG